MTKINFKVGTIGALVWLAFVVGFVYGWISNIITIAHSNFSELTGMLVLRVVGIFVAPIGAIMGYL